MFVGLWKFVTVHSIVGYAVTVSGEILKPERAERELRRAKIPVIARITHDKLWLSVRTIGEDEFDWIVKVFLKVKEVLGCKM